MSILGRMIPLVNKGTVAKASALLVAKMTWVAKVVLVSAAIFTTAAVAGFPIHDIWFDYVLFMIASAIVGGMPEPDTKLSFPRFLYTWSYRSGHLLVASATAYFIHQKHWDAISDGENKKV